jgi:hypothetical protein
VFCYSSPSPSLAHGWVTIPLELHGRQKIAYIRRSRVVEEEEGAEAETEQGNQDRTSQFEIFFIHQVSPHLLQTKRLLQACTQHEW